MKTSRLFVLISVFMTGSGIVAESASAKDGVLSKVQAGQTNYCHLHYPAIREETLSWSTPVLKEPTTGDIIHFYGPCDRDPHGKEEVQSQRLQLRRERTRSQD